MKSLVQQVLSCLLLSACRVNHSDAVHNSLHWALECLLFLYQSPVWRLWLPKQECMSKESLLKWRAGISQWIVDPLNRQRLYVRTKPLLLSLQVPERASHSPLLSVSISKWHLIKLFHFCAVAIWPTECVKANTFKTAESDFHKYPEELSSWKMLLWTWWDLINTRDTFVSYMCHKIFQVNCTILLCIL